MRKWVMVAIFALIVVGGAAPPAQAQDGCFMQLRDCYYRAARESSWVDRWLRGLDCELDFIECGRRKLAGI